VNSLLDRAARAGTFHFLNLPTAFRAIQSIVYLTSSLVSSFLVPNRHSRDLQQWQVVHSGLVHSLVHSGLVHSGLVHSGLVHWRVVHPVELHSMHICFLHVWFLEAFLFAEDV